MNNAHAAAILRNSGRIDSANRLFWLRKKTSFHGARDGVDFSAFLRLVTLAFVSALIFGCGVEPIENNLDGIALDQSAEQKYGESRDDRESELDRDISDWAGLKVHVSGADLAEAKMVIVLCHGYGCNGKDLIPLSESIRVPESTCFAYPDGPVEIGPNRRAWWDTYANCEPALEKMSGLLNYVKTCNPAAKVVLGGFSQGAMLSSNFVEENSQLVSGLLLLSPSGQLRTKLTGAAEKKPLVFISHGRSDTVLPFQLSENLSKRLVELNYQVDWLPFDGGHTIPIVVRIEAGKFLKRLEQTAEKPVVSNASPSSVQRIWNDSPHNAFTDIIRWNDNIYCTFRTGTGHVPGTDGDDGRIQVLESETGAKWRSLAHLSEAGIDLRDPKLSITPDGRLMLLMGGSNYDGERLINRSSRVAFLSPGETEFSKIQQVKIDGEIKTDNDWLWRVTWHKEKFHKIGYGVVYQASDTPQVLRLVRTFDGIIYQQLAQFAIEGRPNESTIRFDEKGQMRIVVRNELGDQGHLGISNPPYQDVSWTTIPIRLGGPNLIQIPDGRWILGTRQYSDPTRTVIGWLADDGKFEKLREFPSAGDTGYPGFLNHDHELWVTYYSSHEGKSSVYLARVPLQEIDAKSD